MSEENQPQYRGRFFFGFASPILMYAAISVPLSIPRPSDLNSITAEWCVEGMFIVLFVLSGLAALFGLSEWGPPKLTGDERK